MPKLFLFCALAALSAGLVAAPAAAQGAGGQRPPISDEPGAGDNPLGAALFLSAPSVYQPGQALTITVEIRMPLADTITALGLYQTLPPGWTFQGPGEALRGPLPSVFKQQESGTVDFAWITVSQAEFPYQFTYVVTPPAGGLAPAEITGYVEYRTNGPAYLSDIAAISFNGIDKTPPVITLNGPGQMSIREGGAFRDPGATATDNVDGDLTARIRVSGSVNAGTAGTYTLAYDVSDRAGNAAQTVTRTVVVNPRRTNNGGTTGGGGFYDPGEEIGGDDGAEMPNEDTAADTNAKRALPAAGAATAAEAPVAPPRTQRIPPPSAEPIRQGLLEEFPKPPAPALPQDTAGNTIAKRDAPAETAPAGDAANAGNTIAKRSPEETAAMQQAGLWKPEPATVEQPETVAALAQPGGGAAPQAAAPGVLSRVSSGQLAALGVLGLAIVVFGGLGWYAYGSAFRAKPRRR